MAFPVEIKGDESCPSLSEFLNSNKSEVLAALDQSGAVIFRGFGVKTPENFQAAVDVLTPTPFDYRGGGSPRSKVSGKISTSTEYAASQHIPLHIEGSYFPVAPEFIWFFAQNPVADRGNTPIGDMRIILSNIDTEIVDEFRAKGLVYVNNLNDGSGFGKSWQEAYGSSDKQEVSAYLDSKGYSHSWKSDGGLRVELHAPAIRQHLRSGEAYWCNQAPNWHHATQDAKTRQAVFKIYGEPSNFPKTVFFGDHSEIPDEMIVHVDEKLRKSEVVFDWQKNDVMLLDNQWISHGRQPYSDKSRKILVSLAG